MSFTIFGRLAKAVRSSAGRKHLLLTWKFALNQAWRAASGIQITEILEQLNVKTPNPTLDLPHTSKEMATKFRSLAVDLGTGKQEGHEFVYQYINIDALEPISVLEIGIGTNNPKLPSSMGSDGKPGSSLDLWKKLFPNSKIFGADVDKSILVDKEDIKCFHLDSTSPESISELREKLMLEVPTGFDLIVDDGLHTPESNLALLRNFYPLLNPGGYYVIEDIPDIWRGFWCAVSASVNPEGWRVVSSEDAGLREMSSFAILRKG